MVFKKNLISIVMICFVVIQLSSNVVAQNEPIDELYPMSAMMCPSIDAACNYYLGKNQWSQTGTNGTYTYYGTSYGYSIAYNTSTSFGTVYDSNHQSIGTFYI